MELSLNKLDIVELSRRQLLQYGSILGISSIAGMHIIEKSSTMLDIPISAVSSSGVIDYSTSSYSVFLLSNKAGYVENILRNNRVNNVYLYGTLSSSIAGRVKSLPDVSSLILSLGKFLPFDYDVSYFDKKSYRIQESFLYLSGVYADYHNGKLNVKEEELRILSSMEKIGKYNRSIYVASSEESIFTTSHVINTSAVPLGNFIFI